MKELKIIREIQLQRKKDKYCPLQHYVRWLVEPKLIWIKTVLLIISVW